MSKQAAQLASGKLGPVTLAPGFSRRHGFGVMISALLCVPLMTFINFIQPYLFNEVFAIDPAEQGRLTGNLAAMHELIIICLISFAGSISDNIGRRVVIISGLLILAVGYLLYPLADSKPEIFLFRAIISLGAVAIAAMHTAIITDTPAEQDRGKFLAIVGVCTGVGMALLALQLGKLPNVFQQAGFSAASAGQLLLWVVVALILLVAGSLYLTLKPGRVDVFSAPLPIHQRLRQGLHSAVENPRIALAYLVAFASRGDIVVVGTYMSLWVVLAGEQAQLSAADGLKRAALIVAAVQGSALLWGMVMGILSDRINRHLAVCIAFALASAAYLTMGLMTDPFANSIFLACIFLGIGEISTVIAGQALLGQEAPLANRGAVTGLFSLCGGLGILIATFIGGRLFDAIGPATPFLMMAVINAVVLTVALFSYRQLNRA